MKRKSLIVLTIAIFIILILTIVGTVANNLSPQPVKILAMLRIRASPNVATVQLSPTDTTQLNHLYSISIWKDKDIRYNGIIIFTTRKTNSITGEGLIQISFPLTVEEISQYPFHLTAFALDANISEDLGKYYRVEVRDNSIDNGRFVTLDASKDQSKTPLGDAFNKALIIIVVSAGIIFLLKSIIGRGSRGGGDKDVIVVRKTDEDRYEIHVPQQRQIFQEPCPNCHGTGWWDKRHSVTCSECHGSGITYVEKN